MVIGVRKRSAHKIFILEAVALIKDSPDRRNMKIAKLVLMTPVLVTCLALAVVSTAQVKRARSAGSVLGKVSLRKYGKNEKKVEVIKVEVILEKNGDLSLGDERIEKLFFQDGSVYLPGSSDQKEVKIIRGKFWADGKQVYAIVLSYGKINYGAECVCYGSPIGPRTPPPPPPNPKTPRPGDPVSNPVAPAQQQKKNSATKVN